MMQFMRSRLRTTMVAAACLSLVACQTTNPIKDVTSVFEGVPTEPTPGQSPEQFRLTQLVKESEQIRGQGLLAGAGVGLVLAWTICDSPLSFCGLAATAGGAAIGYAAGTYVAQKSQLAKEEQDKISGSLNAAQASFSMYNERAEVAEKIVAQNQATVQKMNTKAAATDAERAAYVQAYNNMEDDRDRIDALQSQLTNDLRFLELEIEGRKTAESGDVTDLVQQRDALKEINAQLTSQLDTMNGLLENVPEEIRTGATS